jgi:hypothetical protein
MEKSFNDIYYDYYIECFSDSYNFSVGRESRRLVGLPVQIIDEEVPQFLISSADSSIELAMPEVELL